MSATFDTKLFAEYFKFPISRLTWLYRPLPGETTVRLLPPPRERERKVEKVKLFDPSAPSSNTFVPGTFEENEKGEQVITVEMSEDGRPLLPSLPVSVSVPHAPSSPAAASSTSSSSSSAATTASSTTKGSLCVSGSFIQLVS